jgi:hypothetical protein
MSTTQLQLRRDTTANIEAVTPAQGEPIYDVTRKALVLGDGATPGGNAVTPFGGSWTPTIQGATTAGTPTYNYQLGTYTIVGNFCFAFFSVSITNASSYGGIAGDLEIGGLPFPNVAESGSIFAGVLGEFDGITFTSGYTQMTLEFGGASAPAFFLIQNGSGQNAANLAAGALTGASVAVNGFVVYQIAQPTG